jgi:hypothetical protein
MCIEVTPLSCAIARHGSDTSAAHEHCLANAFHSLADFEGGLLFQKAANAVTLGDERWALPAGNVL